MTTADADTATPTTKELIDDLCRLTRAVEATMWCGGYGQDTIARFIYERDAARAKLDATLLGQQGGAVPAGELPNVEAFAEALWDSAGIAGRCTYAQFAAANVKHPVHAFSALHERAKALRARLAEQPGSTPAPAPATEAARAPVSTRADASDLSAATRGAVSAGDRESMARAIFQIPPDEPVSRPNLLAAERAWVRARLAEQPAPGVTETSSAPSSVKISDDPEQKLSAAARRELESEVIFLLDRLDELGDDVFTEDGSRDFHGHVRPAMARLRHALTKKEFC